MKTYDEALVAATNKPAFSNGTMGEMWTDRWCDRCVHDRSGRGTAKPDPRNNGLLGCALLAVAIVGRTPAEWVVADERAAVFGDYTCVEFEEERRGGGGDGPSTPRPVPQCDGQLDIIDAYLPAAIDELTKASAVTR